MTDARDQEKRCGQVLSHSGHGDHVEGVLDRAPAYEPTRCRLSRSPWLSTTTGASRPISPHSAILLTVLAFKLPGDGITMCSVLACRTPVDRRMARPPPTRPSTLSTLRFGVISPWTFRMFSTLGTTQAGGVERY